MFELIWRSIGALVAVMGFGIVLKVPRRFLLWAGIDGAVGWFIYLIVEQTTGSMLASTFLGAVGIAVGAHICARIFKTPVTIFMIPANLTIVPGAGMYRIVYYILRSEHEMSSYYFQQTILAAGMIAVAIFIVNIILESFFYGKDGSKVYFRKECSENKEERSFIIIIGDRSVHNEKQISER